MSSLVVGLSGGARLTVGEADTAVALGSGDVAVLGTPRVVALCEEATVAAVAGHLEGADTTVGVRIELDHIAPTVVGGRVSARAVLEEVSGRRLRFSVEATEGDQVVASGTVIRVVAPRQRFETRTQG